MKNHKRSQFSRNFTKSKMQTKLTLDIHPSIRFGQSLTNRRGNNISPFLSGGETSALESFIISKATGVSCRFRRAVVGHLAHAKALKPQPNSSAHKTVGRPVASSVREESGTSRSSIFRRSIVVRRQMAEAASITLSWCGHTRGFDDDHDERFSSSARGNRNGRARKANGSSTSSLSPTAFFSIVEDDEDE